MIKGDSFILILMMMFSVLPLSAQEAKPLETQIIDVDTDLNYTSKPLPYDEEFFLRFIYKENPKLNYVKIIEGKLVEKHIKYTSIVTGEKYNLKISTLSGPKPFKDYFKHSKVIYVPKPKYIFFNPIEKKEDNKVHIYLNINRLRPDKDYIIKLYYFLRRHEANDLIKKNFQQIAGEQTRILLKGTRYPSSIITPSFIAKEDPNQSQGSTNLSKPEQQSESLDTTSTDNKLKIIDGRYLDDAHINKNYIDIINQEYYNRLKVVYKRTDSIIKEYRSPINMAFNSTVISQLKDLTNQATLKRLMAEGIRNKNDQVQFNNKSIDLLSLPLPIYNLLNMDNTVLTTIISGKKSLSYNKINNPLNISIEMPDTNISSLKKVINNLDSTKRITLQILLFASLIDIPKIDKAKLESALLPIATIVNQQSRRLQSMLKIYSEISDTIQRDNRLISKEKNEQPIENDKGVKNDASILASSTLLNFDTRVKAQVIPDFGLLYYVAINNHSGSHLYDFKNFNGLIPFIGLNISYSPINKNVPIKYLRGMESLFWRRLSLAVGVTLASIAKEDVRTDLFGNKSLLVGLNYRFSNAIRAGIGTLIFKEKDPNPIISNTSITTAPVVRISLDLSIKEVATDVSSVIFPK